MGTTRERQNALRLQDVGELPDDLRAQIGRLHPAASRSPRALSFEIAERHEPVSPAPPNVNSSCELSISATRLALSSLRLIDGRLSASATRRFAVSQTIHPFAAFRIVNRISSSPIGRFNQLYRATPWLTGQHAP